MTIHFHTQHFISSGLSMIDYMFLMFYEDDISRSIKDLMLHLNLSERSVIRIRNRMVFDGYLEKDGRYYTLTNKLYTNEKVNDSLNASDPSDNASTIPL